MEWNTKKYFCLVTFIYIIIFLSSVFILPSIFGNMYGVISTDQLRINSINNEVISSLILLLMRNVLISVLIITIGVLGIEAIPIIILGWNAISFGEIVNAISKPETIGMIYALLPHAIIEIPAAILCTALSCNFALKMREACGNNGTMGILTYKGSINHVLTKHMIKPYFYYVFPLIVLGCVVESTISLYIMRLIFNGS